MRTVPAWALAKRPPRLNAATLAAEFFSSDRREVVMARRMARSSRASPLLCGRLFAVRSQYENGSESQRRSGLLRHFTLSKCRLRCRVRSFGGDLMNKLKARLKSGK